jgi:CRISPR/Cas system-associated exonuclease Cas4 (RecB family)
MLLRLSQGQLNLLTLCPRKFQHTILDQFSTPTSPEQQERITRGDRFHLLMQQHELGLIRQSADPQERQLQQCLIDLVEAAPELFATALFRQSEHRRTLEKDGFAIAVIYDLLILQDTQAQIIDWKTYPRPVKGDRLAQDWQTRLYLFVLAETTEYEPAQLSITYWFIEPGQPPQNLRFPYNAKLHQQTQQELTQILSRLTEWLKKYDEGESLPQVDGRHCQTCAFAVRCQKVGREEVVNVEAIVEVVI